MRLLPSTTIPNTSNLPAASNSQHEKQATLSYLLETERNSGVTHERDPNVQRQDYRYFPKNTYWLLIEDLEGTHAPIAVKDYGRWRPRAKNGTTKPSGKAALSLNAKKRKQLETLGTFAAKHEIESDEDEDLPPWPPLRDQPGRAKPDWAQGKVTDSEDPDAEGDPEEDDEGVDVELEIPLLSDEVGNADGPDGDEDIRAHAQLDDSVTDGEDDDGPRPPRDPQTLRRTASMADIGRLMSVNPAATYHHHHAPVAGPSKNHQAQKQVLRGADREYNAASGNSVTITSHVGSTTSYAYNGQDLGLGARQLEKRLHQQVLTRATTGTGGAGSVTASGSATNSKSVAAARKSSTPASILSARVGLRKVKSTNALRTRGTAYADSVKAKLANREEAKKPGYCENCRVRFDDFTKVGVFRPGDVIVGADFFLVFAIAHCWETASPLRRE